MKIASIRDFKNKATSYFKEAEPILVTRHGKLTGLYLPLDSPNSIPIELRRELLLRFGAYLESCLQANSVSEKDILEDFKEYKKSRG
jgi:hypothetical protein